MVSVSLRRGHLSRSKRRNSMKSSDLIFVIALVGLIGGSALATPLGLSRSLGSPSLSVLPVHGCHPTYSHDLPGWHRHRNHWEAQRGIVGRFKRNKHQIAI